MSKLFARSPRVSAHLTQEHEWETDVPNIRLSRAFVIVLAIHVVAVGGIIGFELMQPNSSKVADKGVGPEGPADPTPASAEAAPATPALAEASSEPVPAAMGASGTVVKHIVSDGDDVRTILDRYGVTRGDIATANGQSLAATQEAFQGQVLTIHNARRGTSSLDGTVPVMSSQRPRTLPSAPMTHLVDATSPASNYTAENDPSMDRFPDPVSLESSLDSPAEDFMPLDAEPEYTLIDETTEIEVPAPRTTVKAPVTPPRADSVSPTTASGSSHTVKAGDTAYAIGRKYGISPDSLLKANGISDPSALRIGAVLRIPR